MKKLICLFSLGTLGCAFAQPFTVDWFSMDGGGGMSTGGDYQSSGTIGQPDAGGPMTGGTFSLTGGFWAFYAVQSPGSPLLSIKLTSTNTALVSWPSASANFNLQMSTDLASGIW